MPTRPAAHTLRDGPGQHPQEDLADAVLVGKSGMRLQKERVDAS